MGPMNILNKSDEEIVLEISKTIRSRRNDIKISQGQLAKLSGISQSKVSKIERNVLVPNVIDWFKFCKILGINVGLDLGM